MQRVRLPRAAKRVVGGPGDVAMAPVAAVAPTALHNQDVEDGDYDFVGTWQSQR